jgi:FkbM family methyltransferase
MELIKRLALRYLPGDVMKIARTLHYRSSLKNYDIDNEPDLRACQKIVKPGDTVVDVGANIGVFTRFCSEFVGPEGHVISIEPVPETFAYLRSNVNALKLKNVECVRVAASDHDSELERMSIPEYSTGGANLYEAKLSTQGNVVVRTARLDSLVPHLSPSFIKCDVEGHEVECIHGALNLIRRCRPTWMVEVTNPETFDLFRTMKYQAFYYESGEFRKYDPARRTVNHFFFPTSN